MQTVRPSIEPNRPHIPSSDTKCQRAQRHKQPIAPPSWRNKLPEPLIIGPLKSPPAAVDLLDKSLGRAAQAKKAAS
jgi:hypothetical protein